MRSQAFRFSLIVFCSLLVAMGLVDAVVSALWFNQVRDNAGAVARIWALQPLITIYIVINALVFSLLFFFRFNAYVSRPLHSLAAAACRHQDDYSPAFPDLPQLGELHRLSFSLNQMLKRIEQDRVCLQTTAGSCPYCYRSHASAHHLIVPMLQRGNDDNLCRQPRLIDIKIWA